MLFAIIRLYSYMPVNIDLDLLIWENYNYVLHYNVYLKYNDYKVIINLEMLMYQPWQMKSVLNTALLVLNTTRTLV